MPKTRTKQPGPLATLAAMLDRDLATLRREVEAYPDEGDLWREIPGVANVGGTLALHLTGNLQHYFGARLGGTGYVRDRPGEFARRNVPRSELLGEIEAARAAVKAASAKVGAAQLAADFPELIAGSRITAGDYLAHLAVHFSYHLGQLDYHRRVVTGMNTSVGAMRPAELSSARPAGER
jgi:DinB family protein